MTDWFAEAMSFTLSAEGGWYDGSDARDPNPTMYGVIQETYDRFRDAKGLPRRSVKEIGQAELRAIYGDYWYGTCDLVAVTHPITAMCMFDMAINAGSSTSVKLLQRILRVDEDGRLGRQTLAALKAAEEDRVLTLRYLLERVRHYSNLAASPRLRPNLLSWLDRIVRFYNSLCKVNSSR